MRIATVFAVAAAYAAFVDALENAHPMLRELASNSDNQSQLVPARFVFMADSVQPATCQWGGNNVCSFTLGSSNNLNLVDTCAMSVPVPTDNYVNDQRVNKLDAVDRKTATGSPYIQITSKKQVSGGVSVVSTQTPLTTWYDYWKEPAVVQKQISFTSTGVYDLEIEATDYDANAKCSWCLAVRDTFRPVFTAGSCPAAVTNPQTFTATSLAAAKSAETTYDTHVSAVTNNPESGVDCSTSTQKVKNFLADGEDSDDSPDDYSDTASTCYGDSALAANMATLKTTPFSSGFALQLSSPLEFVDKCRWCCQKSKTLKENYEEFACPSTNSPAPVCVGNSGDTSVCNFNLCLTATAADIISTASLSLKSTVQDTSKTVVTALGLPTTTSVVNDIYRTVECTSVGGSDPKCSYSVKLSELFDTPTTTLAAGFPIPSGSTANDFVFWRYKLAGGNWATWDPASDSAVTFSSSVTHIFIEAYTACGRISTSDFDFRVFPHSTLACPNFDKQWVGTPKSPGETATFCNVPGSDFSLVTMKYDYSEIFPATQPGNDQVTGNYKDAECKIVVKETAADENLFVWDTYSGTAGTLLDKSQASAFEKDLAIELVHDPNTAQKTAVHVECTFTRTMLTNVMAADSDAILSSAPPQDPNSIQCTYDFTLVDCDGPVLEPGATPDTVCSDQCAGDGKPGLGEACDGTIVTSSGSVTSVTTPSAAQECCVKCTGSQLQCQLSGTSQTVKACNPFSGFTTLAPMEPLLAQLSAAEEEIASSETMTALLGASAMVAVVALLVVKRRADAAVRARETEDAYYPLLE
ncbi:unnamed protein product [Phytophthora fragariaefolia]|uniref:Unnamed protein product n=1 Tax=Phytophthora fragariaefolia TaxID=1490495 RepID=A0A9W6XYZ3_9STRA|nr:unnamed protein product [Phytophthora fragariaefolia]